MLCKQPLPIAVVAILGSAAVTAQNGYTCEWEGTLMQPVPLIIVMEQDTHWVLRIWLPSSRGFSDC